MNEITTIGLDLAKHVFQVHGVDAAGATVLRKQLRRAQVLAFFSRLPPCLVGIKSLRGVARALAARGIGLPPFGIATLKGAIGKSVIGAGRWANRWHDSRRLHLALAMSAEYSAWKTMAIGEKYA